MLSQIKILASGDLMYLAWFETHLDKQALGVQEGREDPSALPSLFFHTIASTPF